VTAQRGAYPTAQLLPDGRRSSSGVVALGADLNYRAINTPSIEYWPRKPGRDQLQLAIPQGHPPLEPPPLPAPAALRAPLPLVADRYILLDTQSSSQVVTPCS